jgi:enamine deaminase RidA (YjgF/YER057c/UK114 family)
MTRRLISSGSPFEAVAGYSRAVVDGEFAFVAGTTGYDYTTMTMPDGVEQQARNCLATIARVLEEAGFALADVVRATYYVTDIADADRLLPIFGEAFGAIRPAATLVAVAALVRPEMKIEIEVTAKRRS